MKKTLGCLGLMVLLCSCGNVQQAIDTQTRGLRELHLDTLLDESNGGELFSEGRRTHRELLQMLDEVAQEPQALGLFLRVDGFGGGWGRAVELIDALAAIHKAGKPIHCHADELDNLSFVVVANACDRLTVSPSGLLNVVGVAAQMVHARKLLDSLGLRAEMLHVGRYKGAADTLTEEAPTPEALETWNELLDVLDARITSAIGKRLKTDDKAKIRAAIDRGPLTAEDARSLGLVDDLEYDDEARAHAKEAAHADKIVRLRTAPDPEQGFGAFLKAIAGAHERAGTRAPHIALVTLTDRKSVV
jgi:protease-4